MAAVPQVSGSSELDCDLHIPFPFRLPPGVEQKKRWTPFFDAGRFWVVQSSQQGSQSAVVQALVSGEDFEEGEFLVALLTDKNRVTLLLEEPGAGEQLVLGFTPDRGVVAREDAGEAVVVEALRELEFPVMFEGNSGIHKKGEAVRVAGNPPVVPFFVMVNDVQLQGEVPVQTGRPIDRFVFKRTIDSKVAITCECAAEVSVGTAGCLRYLVQLDSEIPVKTAFRLVDVRKEAYLIDGVVAGMRTLRPGRNELELSFVPLKAGFQHLPGLELELLPSGLRQQLEIGPRFFAVPVACTVAVRD